MIGRPTTSIDEPALIACAAVATDRRRLRSVRLAMGGVAHKPWRLATAEAALRNVSLDDIDALRLAIAMPLPPLPEMALNVIVFRGAAMIEMPLPPFSRAPVLRASVPIRRFLCRCLASKRLFIAGGLSFRDEVELAERPRPAPAHFARPPRPGIA